MTEKERKNVEARELIRSLVVASLLGATVCQALAFYVWLLDRGMGNAWCWQMLVSVCLLSAYYFRNELQTYEGENGHHKH